MRTIEFRGKRTDNGEWITGYVLFSKDNSEAVIAKLTDTESVCDNVDPSTVGQFTGLLDKHGKEIYEGDIVEFGNRIQGKSKVIFENGCFIADAKNYATAFTYRVSIHANVIGNIHDNPELMKKND